MDSDLRKVKTPVKVWVPVTQMQEIFAGGYPGGFEIQVDASAWSGIHLAPGDTAIWNPDVRIVANG